MRTIFFRTVKDKFIIIRGMDISELMTNIEMSVPLIL